MAFVIANSLRLNPGKKHCEYSFTDFKLSGCTPGPGCSKPMMSLVNVLLKVQTLIPEIRQYFLLKRCEKLLHCKSSHFFLTKISVYLVIKSKNT